VANDATPAETFQALSAAAKKISNPTREAWEFWSTYSEIHGTPPIKMSVNPNSVSWDQSKRISTAKKTIGGTTYFKWSDKTGRNLDPLILTISGETGPISGLGANGVTQSKTSIITLGGFAKNSRSFANGQNWAKLYTLTTQPEIDPVTFVPNIWEITYRSLLFPNIIFNGFFNQVLKFSDTAASPFSKQYSLSFTVTAVRPDILQLRNLIGSANDVNVLRGSIQQVTAGEPQPKVFV